AKYARWEKAEEVSVSDTLPARVHFTPHFGVLQLTSSGSGASFQLNDAGGRLLEAAEFPATITELPEGRYQLLAEHHGRRRQRQLTVNGNATNAIAVDFVYGTAVFETTPPGARVLSTEDRDLATTPLSLPELEPGAWKFAVRKEGYE